MDVKRLAVVGALGLTVLLLVGCEEYAAYTPITADLTPGSAKDMVQCTAVARYTAAAEAEQTITSAQAVERAALTEMERQMVALTAEAQSTITAQQNAVWATRQALDVRATAQALDAAATAMARAASTTATAESRNGTATAAAAIYQATSTAGARNVQATAEARNATATANSANATATMQAAADAVEKTAQAAQAVMLQATAEAVQRQSEREEAVQGIRTAAPWIGSALLSATLFILGWYVAPVIKARLQVIRRKADEGEPFMVLERERVKLPLRSFDPDGNAALAPELQDRVTARAQLPAVVAAARGRGGRVRQVKRRPAPDAPAIRVVEPDEIKPWLEDARAQLIAEGVTDGDL